MPGIWPWSSTWGGPPFNPLWGTLLLCGSSETWKHCSVPSKYWESPCQVLLIQKEWPQRVPLVAAWSVSEGNVLSLTGPQNRSSGEKWTKRGLGHRDPRYFWVGSDVCLREVSLQGPIHPPPATETPPALTPRVMNEQALPSARDSQEYSFHFTSDLLAILQTHKVWAA